MVYFDQMVKNYAIITFVCSTKILGDNFVINYSNYTNLGGLLPSFS